ncbi:uncharacterized protein (DUF1697 family) [Chitinophaga niastensis]|uniref:Uncharacterized protein (DUF1697 family) n=1 Tax=Chitinophaga niastensis TaxID=536980 RepID=A0A2P8HUL4_CHINA|nr:DUF1697 domain-containing protein [Chitinophaga niastensis]PSL49913.1 uncharacterized protein (DUF1697 family) [Chitinophaga niastensis]
MAKYIAFLRAINVGGNRIVKMESLRQLLTEAGLKNVSTYIQSGNVIFESGSTNTTALTEKIEKLLHKTYGFEVPTIIRSVAEMQTVIKQNPFPGVIPDKEVQIYVAFLARAAGPDAAKIIASLQTEAETLHITEREVYCLVKKKLELKPLGAITQIEKKLGIPCTARNWATVNKVTE